MKKMFAIVYENKSLGNISCGGVATTRALAEALAKKESWFYDRYQIVEVDFAESMADVEAERLKVEAK